MHVPSWLLRILISYLTDRTMTLTYRGVSSSQRSLPGSTPQGAFLGIFLFIVKYNGASLRPTVPRIILKCKKRLSNCPNADCKSHSKESHAVYVDDLAEAEAIDLQRQLVADPITRPFPLNFHERTQHILPAESSLLQKQLLKVDHFSFANQLVINTAKSQVMIFNTSKKYDFPPEFSFSNGQILEVVPSTVLLGIKLTTNLRLEENTHSIYKSNVMSVVIETVNSSQS